MNALEALAAAIAKLEGLKSVTSPGTWLAAEDTLYTSEKWKNAYGHVGPRPIFMAEGNWVSGYAYIEGDVELIVTLHRTIDAQLAILDEGMRTVERSGGFAITPETRAVVALARTILGAAS